MNLGVMVLGLLCLMSVVTVTAEDDADLSHNELIRAYCSLVKTENFYRYFKLRDNCALNVQVFGKKVSVKTFYGILRHT